MVWEHTGYILHQVAWFDMVQVTLHHSFDNLTPSQNIAPKIDINVCRKDMEGINAGTAQKLLISLYEMALYWAHKSAISWDLVNVGICFSIAAAFPPIYIYLMINWSTRIQLDTKVADTDFCLNDEQF